MLTITKDMGEFAASHTLTQHKGGCSNLHGHNYRVEVTLIGNYQNSVEGNPESGMIIDFTVLKELYKKHIHEVVDHATIIGTNEPEWYREFYGLYILLEGISVGEARARVDSLLKKVAHLDIPETTAEYFAKWILETLDAPLQDYLLTLPRENRLPLNNPFPNARPTEVMVYSVSVWETSTSKATYTNPALSPGLSKRFEGGA